MEPSREDLIRLIAYALWRKRKMFPRKPTLDEAKLWAEAVVDHLELSGVRWSKEKHLAAHKTP